LAWKDNGDGSESWNDQICTQKSVTTTSVTCACSRLGEVSASIVVTVPDNNNNNNNNSTPQSASVSAINRVALLVVCLFFALIAYN
jgi:hypothetical protein